jgi:large exoprotein involved in heme utilization and adhesion
VIEKATLTGKSAGATRAFQSTIFGNAGDIGNLTNRRGDRDPSLCSGFQKNKGDAAFASPLGMSWWLF